MPGAVAKDSQTLGVLPGMCGNRLRLPWQGAGSRLAIRANRKPA